MNRFTYEMRDKTHLVVRYEGRKILVVRVEPGEGEQSSILRAKLVAAEWAICESRQLAKAAHEILRNARKPLRRIARKKL